MTTTQQYYQLQELDQEIGRTQEEFASLEGQLGDRTELEIIDQHLETARARSQESSMAQKRMKLDSASVLEKLESDRQKLYGGTLANARDLEAMEREVASLEGTHRQHEESLLDAMMVIEGLRAEVAELEQRQQQGQVEWQAKQEELTNHWQGIGEHLEGLESKRNTITAAFAPQELGLYEQLRSTKGGVAVARVERGLCRGCLVSLPTHQLQKVRMGREPVQCNNCSRILFAS